MCDVTASSDAKFVVLDFSHVSAIDTTTIQVRARHLVSISISSGPGGEGSKASLLKKR